MRIEIQIGTLKIEVGTAGTAPAPQQIFLVAPPEPEKRPLGFQLPHLLKEAA